jgi:large subunit ribosomal protein L7/L12
MLRLLKTTRQSQNFINGKKFSRNLVKSCLLTSPFISRLSSTPQIRFFSETQTPSNPVNDPRIPPGVNIIHNPTDVTPKISKLADEITQLTLLEQYMLTRAISAKLGVSLETLLNFRGGGGGGGDVASQPSASEAQGDATASKGQAKAAGKAEPKKEKTTFSVKVTKMDEGAKYKVLKEFRTIKPEMSLTEAKKLLESLPKILVENLPKEEAEKIAEKLRGTGATVEVE